MAIVVSVFSVSVGERLYYPRLSSSLAAASTASQFSSGERKRRAGTRPSSGGHHRPLVYRVQRSKRGVLKVTQCAG